LEKKILNAVFDTLAWSQEWYDNERFWCWLLHVHRERVENGCKNLVWSKPFFTDGPTTVVQSL